jgi:hypothetical protein
MREEYFIRYGNRYTSSDLSISFNTAVTKEQKCIEDFTVVLPSQISNDLPATCCQELHSFKIKIKEVQGMQGF